MRTNGLLFFFFVTAVVLAVALALKEVPVTIYFQQKTGRVVVWHVSTPDNISQSIMIGVNPPGGSVKSLLWVIDSDRDNEADCMIIGLREDEKEFAGIQLVRGWKYIPDDSLEIRPNEIKYLLADGKTVQSCEDTTLARAIFYVGDQLIGQEEELIPDDPSPSFQPPINPVVMKISYAP